MILNAFDPSEVKELYIQNLCNLIDIKDFRILEEQGRIENDIHNFLEELKFCMNLVSLYFNKS